MEAKPRKRPNPAMMPAAATWLDFPAMAPLISVRAATATAPKQIGARGMSATSVRRASAR